MNKLLSLIAATALLASVSVFAVAQDAGPRGVRPGQGANQGQRMNRLQEINKRVLAQLNLTADQKTKIAALDKKMTEDVRKLMQDRGKPETREKMQALMKKHREDMLKVLTPAQRAEYQKLMKAEMDKLRKEREANGQRAPRRP